MSETMKIDAEWTDDCQGKKDFDGNILAISTRYWPRGGGFTLMRNYPGKPVELEENEARPEIKPSADSSLILFFRDAQDESGDSELVNQHFEAETELEVKRQVEAWAQVQMDRVAKALFGEFRGGK